MIIAIDASRSISTIQKTGVEKVSDELLKHFLRLSSRAKAERSEAEVEGSKKEIPPFLTTLKAGWNDNNFNFIFYTPKQISWLPQENQKILKWPFKFFWTQIRLAWEIVWHRPDVAFFPTHSLPLFLIFFLPFINYRLSITNYYHIIHDIAFKKHPELYSLKQRLILDLDLWLSLKLCTKIFVPSEAVKNDILQYIKTPAEKIISIHWGYKSMNNESGIMNCGERKKQFLYLGRIEEKKNITNLIKAFKIFHEKHPDYKLILAGKIGDWIPGQVGDDNNEIEFLNYISEEKKHQLLCESTALVHVPFEEGFCFPMLEAFDYGLPVIASDIPVLHEIGAGACVYVNPNSPDDIANTMNAFVETQDFASLREKGRARLANFSWSKTAKKILAEITKLC